MRDANTLPAELVGRRGRGVEIASRSCLRINAQPPGEGMAAKEEVAERRRREGEGEEEKMCKARARARREEEKRGRWGMEIPAASKLFESNPTSASSPD